MRHQVGEIRAQRTPLDSTYTSCFPLSNNALTMRLPRSPEPPATATTGMVTECCRWPAKTALDVERGGSLRLCADPVVLDFPTRCLDVSALNEACIPTADMIGLASCGRLKEA